MGSNNNDKYVHYISEWKFFGRKTKQAKGYTLYEKRNTKEIDS